MESINIHEAKIHLSRLVEQAAKGKAFIIAKAGKPMVKVVPLDDAEAVAERRFGFMAGRIKVPADFDDIAREEIEKMSPSRTRRGALTWRSIRARSVTNWRKGASSSCRSRASTRSRSATSPRCTKTRSIGCWSPRPWSRGSCS